MLPHLKIRAGNLIRLSETMQTCASLSSRYGAAAAGESSKLYMYTLYTIHYTLYSAIVLDLEPAASITTSM